ncbi:MAG TPA: TolC family protein [Vicinamibacterales bacterium]|nr:TolC family protein [Vicinamibacterales bacterium]
MRAKRRMAVRVVWIVSLCVLTSPRSVAQSLPAQTPAPPADVTLDDAVHEAVERNLTLVAERYAIAVADARILTARLRPNPVLTANAMFPDGTVFANDVSPREQVVRTDVVIERGGKRDRRIDVAEAAKSVTELQFLNTMRTVVLDVENAFIDVVLAQANAALARESLDAFNALVEVNTERVRTGDLSQIELSRSRLAALQFQNEVRQEESKLAIARGKLNTLLGRSRRGPIDPHGELRRDGDPVDLEALRRRALSQRPDVLALRRDQARSAADLRLQIAQGTIDYTVSGELHYQHQPSPPNTSGFLYGAYLSVPLPIFNRNQGEVARARQEALQIDARLRALEADVNQEVDAAYESYTASRDVVATIEAQMLAQARDVRSTTEYSYRRGEASFVEFLDAVRAFNETMQSYNAARADFARSLYTLDSIGGGPQPSQKVTP